MPVTQILEWKQEVGDPTEWNLWLCLPGRKRGRIVATAWNDAARILEANLINPAG